MFVFSHLNNKKAKKQKQTGNQRSSHVFTAHEQVMSDAESAAANVWCDFKRDERHVLKLTNYPHYSNLRLTQG